MNGLLLDTHVLLWFLDDNARLGPAARRRIARTATVHVSAASTWEIAIKSALGKLTVPNDLSDAITESGLRDLPVTRAHTLASDISALPHRDPFDALLIAQSQIERVALLTADAKILDAYDEAIDARD